MCLEVGLPEPVIEEDQGGIRVTFLKDIYTEEYLRTLGLNERQIKSVLYVKEEGRITNAIYQEINNTTRITATRDLKELLTRNIILSNEKKGVGAEYTLKRH